MASRRPGFESVEEILSQHVPADDLVEVKRIFYGRELQALNISSEAEKLAVKHDFEFRGYKFEARAEQLRAPRIVRVGIIQNHIVLPTSEQVEAQRNAIHERIATIVEAAALCGVNVLCFQEAWPCPFFFCTREKEPWCELAESAEEDRPHSSYSVFASSTASLSCPLSWKGIWTTKISCGTLLL